MELMYVFIIVFIILEIVLVIWAWYDIYKNKRIKTETKAIFALLVFVFPFLGPIVYFHYKYRQIKKRGLNL